MTRFEGFALLEPGAGPVSDLGLGCPTIKVGAALSGQVGVVEGEVPPGGGFQVPHWHEDLDEVFYVLEGEIEFLLDGSWQRAQAGTTVFVPAGMVHAFRNATERPARQLVVGPTEVAELIAELGKHPRERWEEVHERHRSYYATGQPNEINDA
ncbi:MAG: cupin domain-containing protein [Solirubrobacterales bacterium]|nr:cupin domain-containing protein [Solirubrobacterales bacterium]